MNTLQWVLIVMLGGIGALAAFALGTPAYAAAGMIVGVILAGVIFVGYCDLRIERQNRTEAKTDD